jgi:peptide deformylase
MAGGENGSNPAVQAANFPNPFNASTTIQFTVPRRSWITLKIYDVAGKEIETLVNGTLEQGHQTIRWEPRNIASGVYLGRLDAGTARRQFKLLLVK